MVHRCTTHKHRLDIQQPLHGIEGHAVSPDRRHHLVASSPPAISSRTPVIEVGLQSPPMRRCINSPGSVGGTVRLVDAEPAPRDDGTFTRTDAGLRRCDVASSAERRSAGITAQHATSISNTNTMTHHYSRITMTHHEPQHSTRHRSAAWSSSARARRRSYYRNRRAIVRRCLLAFHLVWPPLRFQTG